MSRRFEGYLFLSLAMVMVGSTVIASKLIAGAAAGTGLPPFTATALRFALALPLFLILMRLTGTAWPRPGRRDGWLLLLQGGVGSVGYTTLLISGLRFTAASDAGVIIGTLPVVSAAIAIVILRERPHRFLLLAILLAAIGVLAITLHPDATGRHSWIGNALIFAAVLCEGLFILINKRLNTAISALAQSAIMSAVGLVIAGLAALIELPTLLHGPGAMPISSTAFLAVAYYALVPTVGGFLLWYAGAARVSGAEAALFTALAPVSAVLLAYLMLGEPIGLNNLIGIGCVLTAMIGLGLAHPNRGTD
jgi:drug/metabolite transporter (DMT)-like permease